MVRARLVRRCSLALALVAVVSMASLLHAQGRVSQPFSGPKVNGGTGTMTRTGTTIALTLSSDFKVPDTPDPHWQVVDSKGTVHLLQRLGIKGDKVNTSITLPSYIHDVSRVEIYCSWAETVLGTAPFSGRDTTN